MIKVQAAPHIRYPESTRGIMTDMLITLVLLYVMACYYYGPRALALGLVSLFTALLADCLCQLVLRRHFNTRDLSWAVTGLILPLLMPASVGYHIVVVAVLFAILVAKHPFGGVGHNVYNPAAAGFSFAVISFGEQLFTYPTPLRLLPVFGPVEPLIAQSPAFTLGLGGVPKLQILDMALGNFPGPMGATNSLVIVACLLYLVFRNTVRFAMPLSFFLTVGALAFLFPRLPLSETGRLESMAFEVMSGILLFGGVFLLGDPVTTPKRDWSKAAFGATAGILVMLFRRFGLLEEDFTFAVLLMNATVWGFDMIGERLSSVLRRRKLEAIYGKKIQKKD